MSAWFVWSALGLYPLAGTDKYLLGSPSVDTAILHLSNGASCTYKLSKYTFLLLVHVFIGHVLKIVAINNGKNNTIVQKVELNGNTVDLSHPFVNHSGIGFCIHNLKVYLYPSCLLRTYLWG